jgi:hypothetical protein
MQLYMMPRKALSYMWVSFVLTAQGFAEPVDSAGHVVCLEDWGRRSKSAGTPNTNQANQDPGERIIVRNHFERGVRGSSARIRGFRKPSTEGWFSKLTTIFRASSFRTKSLAM